MDADGSGSLSIDWCSGRSGRFGAKRRTFLSVLATLEADFGPQVRRIMSRLAKLGLFWSRLRPEQRKRCLAVAQTLATKRARREKAQRIRARGGRSVGASDAAGELAPAASGLSDEASRLEAAAQRDAELLRRPLQIDQHLFSAPCWASIALPTGARGGQSAWLADRAPVFAPGAWPEAWAIELPALAPTLEYLDQVGERCDALAARVPAEVAQARKQAANAARGRAELIKQRRQRKKLAEERRREEARRAAAGDTRPDAGSSPQDGNASDGCVVS
jgi:hypothetical protein